MKKFYFLVMSFIALSAIGQTTFYTQSFETTSGYTFPNGNGVGTSTQDFFDRTDSVGAPAQEVFTYTGFDSTYFVAAEDIDGILTTSIGIVLIENIDISNQTNLQFTAAFASGTDVDIDESTDSISVQVNIDNTGWVTIGKFEADSSTTGSTGFNGQFAEDTNFDGFGNGTRLDGTFRDFTWNISGSGDSLDVRILVDLGSGDEEAAFDNIRIAGTPSAGSNYTLQLLHASDLEGGVEALERARFFAAIVDTLEDEFANSITLSAGDNYIPGPFFNAAGDRSTFRDGGVFNNVYNRHFGVTTYDGLRETPGRADISIMNVIGFDASCIGNHEFDAGTDAIEQIIEEDFRSPNGPTGDRWVGAQFPYLSANLDFSASGDLGNLFTGSILENTSFVSGPAQSAGGNSNISKIAAATYISRGGEKIGIVGVTTPILESISSPEEVTVIGPDSNDMVALAAEIQPWIDSLVNSQSINKIVLVTHLQQIQLEEQLAPLLSDVDIIVAGGSDAILANGNDRLNPGDVASNSYPIFKANANGDTLAIVSTNGEYSYVGRLVVEFDPNGVLIPSSLDTNVSGPYVVDSAMVSSTWGSVSAAFADPNGKAALVDSLTSAVSNVVTVKDGSIFGKTDVFLNGTRSSVRTEETNFGNLSADANLWVARQFDTSVKVSIKNGGGIRADIGEVVETAPGQFEFLPPQANPLSGKQEGEISQLDIENTLRFNNGLTVLDLTASGLKQVLEHGVAAWAVGATPGQFAQVGGVKFSFDPTLASGSRIQTMVIMDDNGVFTDTIVRNGAVVGNASRTIKIVTLGFLASGGDSYPFPTLGSNRVDLDTASSLPSGNVTFTGTGTEQDALAEYLLDRFSTLPFRQADTEIEKDLRIQNLSLRSDEVIVPTLSFNEERVSLLEDAGSVTIDVSYNNPTSIDKEVTFRVLDISTADASDFSLASATDTARANTNGTISLNLSITDDSDIENDEIIFLEINTDTSSYKADPRGNRYTLVFIRDNDNVGPTASETIKLNLINSYSGLASSGSTEILDYDPVSQRMFVTNADNNRFEILDFSDPININRIDSVDVSAFGSINSLEVSNGTVATAIEDTSVSGNGTVAFYDTGGVFLSSVTVGVLPDMVTFSPDGNTVVVACEGEPSEDYTQDPEGSIAIIDVSGGASNLTNANVTLLNFNQFDSQMAQLKSQGVRIFGPNASVSQDMEPEYVSISPDNNTAYVVAQENNAVVIVDLVGDSIVTIVPLGWKDHSLAGNGMDTDRRADEIHIANPPFRGFYMPDAISTYEVNGTNFIVSANEGDARDYDGFSEEDRFDDITLNPDSFPNAEELVDAFGDVKITLANGDEDNDGIFDAIYTYGARSFSIWNGTTGALVYDSGDDLEQIVKNHPKYFKLFNVSDDGITIKNRSDDKGPEPEAVVLGEINNTQYAFIGLERTGGVVVYDVSDPNNPSFVDININRDTADGSGDQAPEGLVFIPQSNSPTNQALLVAANEESSTITIWQINDTITSLSKNPLQKSEKQLSVYPNPSSEQVFISMEDETIQFVQLFDMNGRLIKEIQSTKKVHNIQVNDLSPNLYILRIQTESGIRTSKLMVE